MNKHIGMKKIGLYFFCCFFLNISFSQQIKAVEWMVGIWKLNTQQGTIVERWTVKNDSTLQGESVFVKPNKDTVPQEKIELTFRNGEWHYTPIVANQNQGKPVSFKLIFIRNNEFVSENPSHDFPQRIAYRRIKQNLFASIEGKRNGRYGKQNFDFSSD